MRPGMRSQRPESRISAVAQTFGGCLMRNDNSNNDSNSNSTTTIINNNDNHDNNTNDNDNNWGFSCRWICVVDVTP